ncbi:MmcQ/YjbR family DNA-binding protein [Paenibacillus sp. NEAU-GSW1]|uniref:MmcQ/YjbR family DNA-binding protein n=1 Tax=Paenibacillus sp. NEAU-GSW1 TaxID=2682486 RepID=UPI0012E272D7|nr:MmcQ/YjbR family DNA-binding protein [Paenibacillus sp. NEAU-GSW1]MUT68411.1 MmcQ/YjbR family DNA-binding protein [Paenibacillus sp. NEAU-GSW1]
MQSLIEYCEQKRGASGEYPFGPEPLVMKVAGKMFALFSAESVSLKCDPIIAANLREEHAAVKPGYHLNKKHWNTVLNDGTLSNEEMKSMIDHSYELVVASLTKAARQALAELK